MIIITRRLGRAHLLHIRKTRNLPNQGRILRSLATLLRHWKSVSKTLYSWLVVIYLSCFNFTFPMDIFYSFVQMKNSPGIRGTLNGVQFALMQLAGQFKRHADWFQKCFCVFASAFFKTWSTHSRSGRRNPTFASPCLVLTASQ